MKKSECPQLRNARNPRRNACGQAAAAPPTHGGLAAAGTRAREKEPPLFTAARENEEIFRSYRSLFSRQLPSAARWQRSPLRRSARPPRGRQSPRWPARPRGALGGKACPGTAGAPPASPRVPRWSCRVVLSSRPGGLGVLGLWKGACLTERDGGGKPATQGASARDTTSTTAASRRGRQPLPHHTATSPLPTALRSGRATALCPPGHLGRERGATPCPPRLPDLPSRPAAAAPLTRPGPPRPLRGIPRQLRAAAPPAALAAGAERGLPAPSSGGGGAGAAGAAAGPCRGGARRGALPQFLTDLWHILNMTFRSTWYIIMLQTLRLCSLRVIVQLEYCKNIRLI
ncbi:uncharacterized protein LJ206_014499 [Theristicus caerulescens]